MVSLQHFMAFSQETKIKIINSFVFGARKLKNLNIFNAKYVSKSDHLKLVKNKDKL